jgi:hypothetical protein
MTRRTQKRPRQTRPPKPSPEEKKHINGLLDEALEETFPASDPPAMLEPAPDSPNADEGENRSGRGDKPVKDES